MPQRSVFFCIGTSCIFTAVFYESNANSRWPSVYTYIFFGKHFPDQLDGGGLGYSILANLLLLSKADEAAHFKANLCRHGFEVTMYLKILVIRCCLH
jgi:hypothetical protein